ncbi:beta-ketoacyl synthase N-terminal-like domain-containing protein [Streptomyces sp. NPDC039022]|uniref:beta-ketoacyl synthase N-terminal-like domain-containing protein n=1 Tax=Streptomyces sp. NPDC039022 TaxID=3157091 RepID=UPI0033D2776D
MPTDPDLRETPQGVAVIGMACRFPGAPDIEAYWENLVQGACFLTSRTPEHIRALGVPGELQTDPQYVPVSGTLDDIDQFDADYFGISPAEAAAMDPQHRLLLQEAVHALEHAGWAGRRHDRRIGVFCGGGDNRYARYLPGGHQAPASLLDSPTALPLRVSYHLNLRGPSVFVSSSCSTSLTAIHLARRSLLAGDCDLALVGAVSLLMPYEYGYRAVDGGVLAPDGRLRPFDDAAGGTVPGSGVGVVVLKRLDDSLRDGDTVHAVVRGSALSNDGADRQSFAAPTVRGQREAIVAALTDSGVDPATVGYVEAHGTGTPLGDPVELAALKEARGLLGVGSPCAVGTVKSSVGHLDIAAGMAGFLKTVLALRAATVPATVGHSILNTAITLEDSGLYINTRTRPWPESAHPRRAAVTSLGLGGANAHVVLEQSPDVVPAAAEPVSGPQIYPVSAHSPRAFHAVCEQLARAVPSVPGPSAAADVAFTLQEGREARQLRRAWVTPSLRELAASLREGAAPTPQEPLVLGVGLDEAFAAGPPGIHLLADRLPRLRTALERRGPDRLDAFDGVSGDAFRAAHGALEALRALGVTAEALAAVGAGEYVAFAFAGVLPWDVAMRGFLRHTRMVAATGRDGDLSRCERELMAIERELTAAPWTRPSCDLLSVTLGETLPAGKIPSPDHLVEVSRSAVLGGAETVLPARFPLVLPAPASWEQWLGLVAHCWERGADVAWDLLPRSAAARRTVLPSYPFDTARHWAAEPPQSSAPPVSPAADAPAAPVTAPSDPSEIQEQLAEIWRQVLGVESVAPDDSFFELGGHSIVASQVLARIRERLRVRVPLGDLLDAETLAGMTELVIAETASMNLYRTLTSDGHDDTRGTVEL